MSYTSADQVRHHLVTPYPIQEEIRNQLLTLSALDYVQFFGGAVEESSMRVKSIGSQTPLRVTVTLNTESISFTTQPVVSNSVVAASDSSLGTVYTENVDYVLDYVNGTLTIKDDGAILPGQQLTIWYVPFVVYTSGSDYQLQSETGKIRRLSNGDIASGQTVYLDYTPVYVSFTDEIINNAVTLANGMVETEIDPDRQFETDPRLGAVATYKALEIICRTAASRELASLRGEDRSAVAWMTLANDYGDKSETLLKSFKPPYENPHLPVNSRRR